jgi:hypothetical protein
LRFDFRLLVPPDKASTTAGQNRYEASKDFWVACGIALRAHVKDLKSLAVAACEVVVAQNGEGADFVPRDFDF